MASEAGQYSTAIELFAEGSAMATDPEVKARLEFRQAVALQQMANLPESENREDILRQATRLYHGYLKQNPESAATANNLAKIYEALGDESIKKSETGQAKRNYKQAAGYYQIAVAINDASQGLYLNNYGKFLEKTGDWKQAKIVYTKLIQGYPVSPELQQSLTASYLEHGLEDLTGYLWNLLNKGYVRQSAKIALDALLQSANEANDSRIDLLTIVCAALAQDTDNRESFPGSETGRQITALTSDSLLSGGADGISNLYRGQQLNSSDYDWWTGRNSISVDSDEIINPLEVFRALIRSLGSRSKLSGDTELAESYFRLAAVVGVERFEIDPIAVRDLVRMYAEENEFNKIEGVLKEYEVGLYESKAEAYRNSRVEEIFEYHKTLGELYSLIEKWGDSETVDSAIFQLEHARKASLLLESNSPKTLQENYQFTPQMVEQLSRAYEKTGNPTKSQILRTEQAKIYTEEGDLEAARRILDPISEVNVDSTPPNPPDTNTKIDLPGEITEQVDPTCQTTEMELMNQTGQTAQTNQTGQTAQPDRTVQANHTSQEDSEEKPETPITSDYIGDDIRLAIGYDSETDLTGEFFWNYKEDSDSAYSFEGWKGDDSSGGVKLNFHWLTDGVSAGDDEAGNPIYSDGKVRKLFVAADRNVYSDGKVTFGGGSEHQGRFWSLYGSKSTTGKRNLGQTVDIERLIENGIIDNHAYTQIDTWTTTTDFFAHPYDWGIGFRVGRYFENSLIRIRGGFDYEDGEYSSNQFSGYTSLDKRFKNSSQGLSFRAEIVHKSGDFETDKNDVRLSAFWSWEFGTSFRPSAVYRNVQVETMPDTTAAPPGQQTEVRLTRVTRQFELASSFELDKSELTDASKVSLEGIVSELRNTRVAGKIMITGHTCSLGSAEYNQTLSEKRAKAAYDFLINKGFNAQMLCVAGRGEMQPRFSNETEEGRSMNRRVEVSYIAEKEVERPIEVVETQPVIQWVQELVPTEAAWIRRALRNPVAHKRTVDYYRYNQVSEQHETERELINTGSEAENDDYEVLQDSTGNPLNVLDNDSDPEYDNLKIIAVSNPAHGTATISGSTILYTPDPGFYGTDTFSYEIEDIYVTEPHPPGPASTAQVSINVIRLNQPPVAMDDAYEVMKNTADNAFAVLVNDSDPDGDDLTIIGVATPGNGTVTFTGEMILYTPNQGFSGEDSFEYTITDGKGAEATAWVTVTIVNKPPVAVDDSASTSKNTSVVIDVLANDFDPDGDPLTIVAIILDGHPKGTVVDNGDGTLTYSPTPGWWGGDEFQYTISDGEQTSTATVTLKVIFNNQNPR